MATLPDLNPEEDAGLLYYYKSIDTPQIDGILSKGAINTYTLYDNGVIAKFDSGNYENARSDFTVRVKTDGWIVAYWPQNGYQTGKELVGTNDYLYEGAGYRFAYSIMTLQFNPKDVISDISSYVNVSGPNSLSEVGIFDYNLPDATNIVSMSGLVDEYATDSGTYKIADEITVERLELCQKGPGNMDINGADVLSSNGYVDLQSEFGLGSGDTFDYAAKSGDEYDYLRYGLLMHYR